MQLAVSLNDVEVGTLARGEDGQVTFAIAGDYQALRGRPVLGQFYVDKLRRPPAPEPGMPAFFANLLPEGELRRLLATALGAREQQDFRLLAGLGNDLPGAVRVRRIGDHSDEEPPVEAAQGPLAGKLRFSLAGVQLKFSMARDGKQLVLPARGQGGDWILKLPDLEFPELPENEYAVMNWARASGIEVPECNVFTHADVDGIDRRYFSSGSIALGVRRFDRPQPGQRVHIEDFAQVNGIQPVDKYDDRPEPRSVGRLNYETLARQILVFCGEVSLREYIRRLVFMVLSGNADAHLKNWSLLYRDGRTPVLSPAYDQVATVAYPGHGEELALPFVGALRFEDVSLQRFRRLARALGPERDPEAMVAWVRAERRGDHGLPRGLARRAVAGGSLCAGRAPCPPACRPGLAATPGLDALVGLRQAVVLELLPQLQLGDLAGGGVRQAVDELDGVGQPPLRDVRGQVCEQHGGVDLGAGSTDDEQQRALAPARVGDADDGGLGDAGATHGQVLEPDRSRSTRRRT